jgi:hypothetical protein
VQLSSISRAECGALQLLLIRGGFSRETRTTSSIFLRRVPSSYTLACCPSLSRRRETSASSPVTPCHSYIAGAASNYVPGDDDREPEWGYYNKLLNTTTSTLALPRRLQLIVTVRLSLCLLWICFKFPVLCSFAFPGHTPVSEGDSESRSEVLQGSESRCVSHGPFPSGSPFLFSS